jgi:hypothetical protein
VDIPFAYGRKRAGGCVCVPVDEVGGDAERGAQALEREAAVALEQLRVREDAHLAHVEPRVRREDARRDQVGLLERRCAHTQSASVRGGVEMWRWDKQSTHRGRRRTCRSGIRTGSSRGRRARAPRGAPGSPRARRSAWESISCACFWSDMCELTRFFRSTRLRVSALAMTVRETKSLYARSSVAVKVEMASRRSAPPRANSRIEMRCRPL